MTKSRQDIHRNAEELAKKVRRRAAKMLVMWPSICCQITVLQSDFTVFVLTNRCFLQWYHSLRSSPFKSNSQSSASQRPKGQVRLLVPRLCNIISNVVRRHYFVMSLCLPCEMTLFYCSSNNAWAVNINVNEIVSIFVRYFNYYYSRDITTILVVWRHIFVILLISPLF